jgi:hypothetical protein
MEDKTFAMLEKIYSEFLSFKDEMLDFKKETNKNFQKLENKLDGDFTPKIDALFDGYKANSELLEELNDKIDNLQVDVNNLSIKVVNNDNRIIEIKRNLRSVK